VKVDGDRGSGWDPTKTKIEDIPISAHLLIALVNLNASDNIPEVTIVLHSKLPLGIAIATSRDLVLMHLGLEIATVPYLVLELSAENEEDMATRPVVNTQAV
jgi:hypothetical protein